MKTCKPNLSSKTPSTHRVSWCLLSSLNSTGRLIVSPLSPFVSPGLAVLCCAVLPPECSLEEFNRRINVALTEAEAGLKPFKDWKHKAHHRCNGIFGYLCLAVGVASSPKSRHSHVSVVNYETLQSFNPIMKAVASESAAASDDGARQMIEALVGQFMDQEATTFVANGGDRAGKQAVAAEGKR